MRKGNGSQQIVITSTCNFCGMIDHAIIPDPKEDKYSKKCEQCSKVIFSIQKMGIPNEKL